MRNTETTLDPVEIARELGLRASDVFRLVNKGVLAAARDAEGQPRITVDSLRKYRSNRR